MLCLVAVSVLWLSQAVLWAGLQCVIVVFPGYTYFLFSTGFLIFLVLQFIYLVGKRGLVALLLLCSECHVAVIVLWLFLMVP